ncbi:MAG TPA: glycosyl hydrolase, partial [Saprospiraceae bacterium]|nr:glycosyl hydrolase [Saprospiraceae bacterium]
MHKTLFLSILLSFIFIDSGIAQHKNILIDNNGTPNEPSIIINYKNPAQVLAASNINNYYVSTDTGKIWVEDKLSSQY